MLYIGSHLDRLATAGALRPPLFYFYTPSYSSSCCALNPSPLSAPLKTSHQDNELTRHANMSNNQLDRLHTYDCMLTMPSHEIFTDLTTGQWSLVLPRRCKSTCQGMLSLPNQYRRESSTSNTAGPSVIILRYRARLIRDTRPRILRECMAEATGVFFYV